MRYTMLAGACALALCSASVAMAGSSTQPDDHAPIGVMGDHLHKAGGWMVGYRYEYLHSSGVRSGRHSVDNAAVLASYGEAPIAMDMEMHMLEVMRGITDNLTLMVMPQYMYMGMTHLSHGGHGAHEHEVEGIGDTEVTGLYSVYRAHTAGGKQEAHLNIGMSLPTGSIDEAFTNHHAATYRLPYNMQFGSGTFDPMIGATYTGEQADWSWGAQTLNYIRLGKNDNGYRQGNKYMATTWVARNLNPFTSLSLRLEAEAWDNVSGRDASLPVTAIAGADPDGQAGERVMALVGLNLFSGQAQGPLAGQRLAAELGIPLHERFSGPQPETDYRMTLGWQWAF